MGWSKERWQPFFTIVLFFVFLAHLSYGHRLDECGNCTLLCCRDWDRLDRFWSCIHNSGGLIFL